MRESPFISFVIPCRNSANTISMCVRSIVEQTYPSSLYEILVVDNGSTDATAALAAKEGCRVLTEPKVGRAHARNRGIQEARGECIAFVDSDAVLHPQWTHEMISEFRCQAIGGVQSKHRLVTKNPKTFIAQFRRWTTEGQLKGSRNAMRSLFPLIDTAACMYRAEAVRMRLEPFNPIFVRGEDLDLCWQVICDGWSLGFAEKAEADIYYDPPSVVRYIVRAFWEGYYDCYTMRAWEHFFKPWKISFSYYRTFKRLPGRAPLVCALIHYSCMIARVIGWTLSSPPEFAEEKTWKEAKEIVPDPRFRFAADTRLVIAPLGVRVLRRDPGMYTVLNESASAIVRECASQGSIHTAAQTLSEFFDVPTSQIEEDAIELFTQLQSEGLIESTNG